MTYILKPQLHHPKLAQNSLGFTRRDYEGSVSTLCAGCGHDSISAALVQACWELEIDPARLDSVRHYDGTPITARFIATAIAGRVNASQTPAGRTP